MAATNNFGLESKQSEKVAERILTLGPLHSFTEYVQRSEIREATGISDASRAVDSIVNGFKVLIIKERELLKLASDADDEGTSALMSDYIRSQEKMVWMYSSFLGRK